MPEYKVRGSAVTSVFINQNRRPAHSALGHSALWHLSYHHNHTRNWSTMRREAIQAKLFFSVFSFT